VVDGAENNFPTFIAQNHFQVAKNISMTEHLIIPEILVFSKKSWDALSKEDQALVAKAGKETQTEQRALWYKAEDEALAKMKAAGIEIIKFADKKPFQDAVKPVWDKYGAKYTELVKRIQDVK
jgi:TRAP-type C4-dicarboxylate transport system substrate-binding protein